MDKGQIFIKNFFKCRKCSETIEVFEKENDNDVLYHCLHCGQLYRLSLSPVVVCSINARVMRNYELLKGSDCEQIIQVPARN